MVARKWMNRTPKFLQRAFPNPINIWQIPPSSFPAQSLRSPNPFERLDKGRNKTAQILPHRMENINKKHGRHLPDCWAEPSRSSPGRCRGACCGARPGHRRHRFRWTPWSLRSWALAVYLRMETQNSRHTLFFFCHWLLRELVAAGELLFPCVDGRWIRRDRRRRSCCK